MRLRSNLPILAQPYRGYANSERIFLQGRVLADKGIAKVKSESWLNNFLDSFKRFGSDEVEGVEVKVRISDQLFSTTTDREGYFRIDERWRPPTEAEQSPWVRGEVQLPASFDAPVAIAEICLPSAKARLGIISDIDDTVLQTHMYSPFKWKMLYATLFKNADQRLPMEGMPALLRKLVRGKDGQQENPAFYVSDSPWNLYDLLIDFMKVAGVPDGPLLLRDYGRQIITDRKKFAAHKLRAIDHLMKMYPDLPFIMLGDTASKDADYYLHFARKYAGRVAAIYIRNTSNTRNARRIARLLQAEADIVAIMVKSSLEIYEHAREKGFLE